jgi:hypothetical protein
VKTNENMASYAAKLTAMEGTDPFELTGLSNAMRKGREPITL